MIQFAFIHKIEKRKQNKRSGFPLCRIPDGKSPRFPKKPTIRQEGDILIMECILEAHPLPDIAWYQGEKSVTGSDRIKMSRKATSKDIYVLTLEISNPTREDGGNYRCNAFNSYGESNANIALNFQGIRFRFHFTSTNKNHSGRVLGQNRTFDARVITRIRRKIKFLSRETIYITKHIQKKTLN